MPEWRWSTLYQRKKSWQKALASSMEAKRSGKPGRYLRVLNCDSEYGLSLETCGREWVLVTPRSASRKATGFEVIDEPRSAWRVNCPAGTACLASVSAIRRSASSACSRWATIQPTTYRL